MNKACYNSSRNGGATASANVKRGVCGQCSRRQRLDLISTFLVLVLSLLTLMVWNTSSSLTHEIRFENAIFSEVSCVDDCCDVPLRMNRSCWYRNLYFRNGQFYYIPDPHRPQFSNKSPSELSVFMGDRVQFSPPWCPVIVSTPEAEDVEILPYGNASRLALHSWNASVQHVSGTYVL